MTDEPTDSKIAETARRWGIPKDEAKRLLENNA